MRSLRHDSDGATIVDPVASVTTADTDRVSPAEATGSVEVADSVTVAGPAGGSDTPLPAS